MQNALFSPFTFKGFAKIGQHLLGHSIPDMNLFSFTEKETPV